MTEETVSDLVRMWMDGTRVSVIAERLGYSELTIMSYVSKHRDMFPYRRHRVDEEEMARHVSMIIEGRSSVREAAAGMKVCRETVRRRLRLCRRSRNG